MTSHAPDLVTSEQLMSMTFDRAPVGMALLSLDGRWLRVNPALCSMTKLTPKRLLAMTSYEMTHPDDLPLELNNHALVIAGRLDDYAMSKRYRDADGSWIAVRQTNALLRNADGQPGYVVAQIERIDRLRQEAQVGDNILAATGHELRTPLTAIVGYADILRDRWDIVPETARVDALTVIGDQARALTATVGDLLSLCELRNHQLNLDLAVVAVNGILDALRDAWPDLRVDVDIDPTTSVLVDPGQFQSMLIHLLDNARKFGAPPVCLSVQRHGSFVLFAVEDSGPGVPEDFVPYLFERFSQADAGTTRQTRGLGIGLALVQELAAEMGGHAWYEPSAPSGARFLVTAPAVDHEPPVTLTGGVGDDEIPSIASAEVTAKRGKPAGKLNRRDAS